MLREMTLNQNDSHRETTHRPLQRGNRMPKPVLLTLFLLLSSAIAAHCHAQEPTASSAPQSVVVHLTHFTDDLHRCFMALKLAALMQEADAEVTLFLDLEGVRLAERRQTLDMTWGSGSTTLAELYERFVTAGGKVVLCPHCAESAKIGDPGLKRNAALGTEQELGKLLLAADKILDY